MTKQQEINRYVRITDNGVADARRFHLFNDCAMLKGASGDSELENLSEREANLLGLKACSVCEKRESGGPAIDVLEGFFGEDWPYDTNPLDTSGGPRDLAWKCIDYLKERGFYIASRRKTETNGSE